MTWADRAAAAHRVLIDRFWDGERDLFRVTARRRLLGAPHWHYWWQAHALDALVDAVARAEDGSARDRVAAHAAGIVRRNGGRIVNDYYDDMGWMGLALLRAQEVAGVEAAGWVGELWADIRGGWDDRHGGIVWRRHDNYTNAPANGPAALLAARLYARDGDPADLEWARRIEAWLHATLVDPETGLVWDGVHPDTDPHPSREIYTYNQGTVLGVDAELYRLTGDVLHLARATRTAHAALSRLAGPDGAPPAEGTGDGGLFKGVMVRYLGEFTLVTTAPPDRWPTAGAAARAAHDVADRARSMLVNAGEAIAAAAASGPVGPDWRNPAADGGSLSTHLSAVLLLETVARLDAAGTVGRELSVPPG